MYIPEFWTGVMATLFSEFIITMVLVIISTHKKGE